MKKKALATVVATILLPLLFVAVIPVISAPIGEPPAVTNPTANPSSIPADGIATSRLNVTVTDDVGIDTVKVNLTHIGGSENTVKYLIDDNLCSYVTTATVGISPRTYHLPVNATDVDGNSNISVSIPLEVTSPATTVSIENANAPPGGTTTTTVMANNVTDLATFDINVSYDPSVVNVTNAENNPGLGTNMNNLEHADEGWVRLVNFNIVPAGGGLSGDVWISNLSLEAVGDAGDESILAITIISLSNSTEGDIPASPVNGMFTVGLKGDIMGDGDVDIDDAVYLAKHVAGWSGYEVIHANGDIMGDGDVDIDDAVYLAKHVAGWSGYEVIDC